MNQVKEQFIDIVKEKGIVNMIFDLKKELEWVDFIELHNNNWDEISRIENLPLDFMEAYKRNLNWIVIEKSHKPSSELIRKFFRGDELYWMLENQVFSEELIREVQNSVNWHQVSGFQVLSEEFIREVQDKVDWTWISMKQKLSEDFIREFQNRVDWLWILAHQNLSEEFIEEFRDRL